MRADQNLAAQPELAREFAEFFQALSVAYQRAQIYPVGHPSLDRAVDEVVRRLHPILLDEPSARFAVGPNQLFVGASATDPARVLLRELSTRLFRRNIGAVRISRGITRDEIAGLLQALLLDGGGPLPVTPRVEITPLNFDGLALEDRPQLAGEESAAASTEEIWGALAQVMLGTATLGAGTEAADLAAAFDGTMPDPARDAAVVGFLASAAAASRGRETTPSTALRRRISQLLRRLRPGTLERLLSAVKSVPERNERLLDLLHLASAPLALDLLLAASRVSHRTLSPALVQLLTKLASHADAGPPESRRLADDQLHQALTDLIQEWDTAPGIDPAAIEYEETLDHLPAPLVPDLDPTEAYRPDPYRIVTMHLDMRELGAAAASRAIRTLVARGRVRPLVSLLDRVPKEDPLAAELLPLVATPDALCALLAARPIEMDLLERIAPEVGTPAIPLLLDQLADSEERGVRRHLLELLARFGNAVTPFALARIDQAPWFVQRNLLRMLQTVPDPPAEAVAVGFARHPDARVRVEGLRLLLRLPAARARGIVEGLTDRDPVCLRVAVMAAAEHCPPSAAPLLIGGLLSAGYEAELRAVAIRALAPLVDDPAVLEVLLKFAGRRIPILGWWLAPKSRESLAALSALARHWRWQPRTARLLARAERHRDAEIRGAVTGPTVFEQLGMVAPDE